MEHLIWNIDPVLISFAGLSIHWYGALFATAILAGLQVMKWIYQQEKLNIEALDTLLVYAVFGIIIGARLGHCLFYDPEYYLSNPIKILAIWEGGLASHGGGLGVIIATALYAKKHQVNLLWLLDRLAIATALFGFFVRAANFVNSEILGVPSQVSWAIVFQRIDNIPRHPVQLYEAFSYLLIFVVLIAIYKASNKTPSPKKKKSTQDNVVETHGRYLGTFLILVFTARFIIEFFKEKQAVYAADFAISTGQMLSLPFFIVGIVLVVRAMRSNNV